MSFDVKQSGTATRMLDRVREHMPVHDIQERRLGTVRRVYLGDATDPTRGAGVATPSHVGDQGHSFLDDLAASLAPAPLPAELRDRLRLHGFITVDTEGVFAADRDVPPEQIARVTDDHVILRVTLDELITR